MAHVFAIHPQFPTAVKGMPVFYTLTRTKYALANGETISITITDNSPSCFINPLTADLDAAIAGKPGVTRSGNVLTFNWLGPRNLRIKRETSQNFTVAEEQASLTLSAQSAGTIFPASTTAAIIVRDQTKGHPWWQSPRAGSQPGALRFTTPEHINKEVFAAQEPASAAWAPAGKTDTSRCSLAFGLFLTDHDLITPNFWMCNSSKNNVKLLRSASGLSLPQVIIKSATSATNLISVIPTAGLKLHQHHRVFISWDLTKPTLAEGLHLWIDDTNVRPATGTWGGNAETPPVMAVSSALNAFYLMSGGGNADEAEGDLSFFWLNTGTALDFSNPAVRDLFWFDTLDDKTSANPSGFRGGAPLGGGTARPDVYVFGNKADFTAQPATNNYGAGNLNLRVSTVAKANGFVPSSGLTDIPVGTPSARTIYAAAVDADTPYTIGTVTGLPSLAAAQNMFDGVDVSDWKETINDEFDRPAPTTPDQIGYFNNGDLTAGGDKPWETVFKQFREVNDFYNLRNNGPNAMRSLYIDAGGTFRRPDAHVGGNINNANTDPVSGGWLPGVCEGHFFKPSVLTLQAGVIPAVLKPEITKNDPKGVPFVFYSSMITTDGRGPMPALGGSNMFFGMDVGLIEWRVRFARGVFPLTTFGHFPAFWSRRSPNGAGGSTSAFESDIVELLGHSRRTWTTTNIIYTTELGQTIGAHRLNRNLRDMAQGPIWGPWMVIAELTTLDSPAGSARQAYYRDGTLISSGVRSNVSPFAVSPTDPSFAPLDGINPCEPAQNKGALQGGMRHLLATLQIDGGYNYPNTPDNTTDFESCMMEIDYVRVRQPIGAKFIRKGSPVTTVSASTSLMTL